MSNFQLINLHPPATDMKAMIREGLQKQPRQLPAWLLYDKKGSELFAKICLQPEYTLTKTEQILLTNNADKISKTQPENVLIVEFGAGRAEKVSPLLNALTDPAYLGLDISAEFLRESCVRLQKEHQNVPILAVCADYSHTLTLPLPDVIATRPRLGFFPGSSLGNFDPSEAINFLRRAKEILGVGASLLIGIDQPRDSKLLEAAYDDAAGVSAEFALNLISRLNEDVGCDLSPNLHTFRYRARWQETEQRIEMALVSEGEQTFQLAGVQVTFADQESWITEYSYKYTPDAFVKLAAEAGWVCRSRYCDDADTFSLHMLESVNCSDSSLLASTCCSE